MYRGSGAPRTSLTPRARSRAAHALAFASAAQREHGLPPDDESALRLNETQLVVTVPERCKPGDSFDVKMEFGARAPHCTGSRCTGRRVAPGCAQGAIGRFTCTCHEHDVCVRARVCVAGKMITVVVPDELQPGDVLAVRSPTPSHLAHPTS